MLKQMNTENCYHTVQTPTGPLKCMLCETWENKHKRYIPVLGPLYRRWLLLCDDPPSWPMVVLLVAEAEVGMVLGLGTVVGKVCERGKFLEWGLGSLLTSSGMLSLLSSLSCLCHVWRDSSPRDCCLWSYHNNNNNKKTVTAGDKMHGIQDGDTHVHICAHKNLPHACKVHGCSSQWRRTLIRPN